MEESNEDRDVNYSTFSTVCLLLLLANQQCQCSQLSLIWFYANTLHLQSTVPKFHSFLKFGSEPGGGKAGSGWLRAYPLKFGAEVRYCVRRLCRTGVKVMTLTSELDMDWIHLQIELDWTGLDWIGLGWVGSIRMDPCPTLNDSRLTSH